MKEVKANPKLNASGYKDLTAYEAVNHVTKEEKDSDKQVWELIKVVKYIVEISGYEIIGRIAVRNKDTRREYR